MIVPLSVLYGNILLIIWQHVDSLHIDCQNGYLRCTCRYYALNKIEDDVHFIPHCLKFSYLRCINILKHYLSKPSNIKLENV